LLFAAAWILLSDRVLRAVIGPDRFDQMVWFQTTKGLLFVGITAGLLFGLVTRRLRQVRAAETESADVAARLATFTDNLPGVAFIKDAAGRFVFARGQSDGAAAPTADVLNGAFVAGLTPDERATIARHDRVVLEGGGGSQLVETLSLAGGPGTTWSTGSRSAAPAASGCSAGSRWT
jgi:hypothetical protein